MNKYLISFLFFASVTSYCCARSMRRNQVLKDDDDQELDEEISLLERLLGQEVHRKLGGGLDDESRLSAIERRQNLVEEEPSEVSIIEPRPKRQHNVNATDFLEKFGYLPVMKEGVQHDPASRTGAIRRFQKMYNIKQTGILDETTQKMMVAPRCGMPDMIPEQYLEESMGNMSPQSLNQELKANNFYVPGYKWPKLDLTWHLKNFWNHPALSQETQRAAITKAFKFWSDASNLNFRETSDKGDVNMQFVARQHDDGPQNSFDGPSGVLAHAFYPQSGELHFDGEESWTDAQDAGINLMIVAAHELGHAMGLGHSDAQGALMAPYYQGYIANYKLPADDTRAIQSLYGSRQPSPGEPTAAPVAPTTKTTTTTKAPAAKVTTVAKVATKAPVPGGPPDTCSVVFKAVTQIHDYRIYAFNGPWMWRMSDYGLDTGYPVAIKAYYENAPESPDDVLFSWKTYYTYMFKGDTVWRYYGFQLDVFKTITTQGYPNNPQSAVARDDSTICLLKDGSCWTFDEELMDITTAAPRPFQESFPGAPSTFDSVVRLANDASVYFFKANNYYKYDVTSKKVLPGYPKAKQGPWMGPACGAQPYTPK